MTLIMQEDFLLWLMDEAKGPEQDPAALATCILIVNPATIHTSSMVHSPPSDLSFK